ncbi:sec1 family domain-containing protein [Ditylenchus destructor]|nr:sec1 family domain-containing protein [Ditylenchus destructor]
MDYFNDEFSLITKLAREELIHVLESIPGTKQLVVEGDLMRPLDRIVSMSLLQEHNCCRVLKLDMNKVVYWDEALEHRVFLLRPSIALAKKVCELIKSQPSHRYSVIVVDRRRQLFEIEFEKQGLFGIVDFYEFNLSLIPIESDLFSLEMPIISRRNLGDDSWATARALWQLQSLYGCIPTTFCIGPLAKQTERHFRHISSDMGEPAPTADQPISHIFIFDRQMDIISTLMTCLTYESMLNDHFQYSCAKISFGEAVEAKLKQKANVQLRVFPLNNSDSVFSAIRNAHMTFVFPFLSAKAKELQASIDKASGLSKMEDMKNFVSTELRTVKDQHKSLEVHICACEAILEWCTAKSANERFTMEQSIVQGQSDSADIAKFIENAIRRRSEQWHVLQLICLWSLRENGIPTKHYANLQAMFLRTYGYEQLPVFLHLKLKGLLTEKAHHSSVGPLIAPIQSVIGSSSNTSTTDPGRKRSLISSSGTSACQNSFSSIAAALNLCPRSPQEEGPNSTKSQSKANLPSTEPSLSGPKQGLGYIFSDAYVPLISRLLELCVTEGWNDVKFKKVLGEGNVFCTNPSAPKPDNRIHKAILVCFVGGVTFAEIASLRAFAQNRSFRVIIITSNIIHRENFLQSLATVT